MTKQTKPPLDYAPSSPEDDEYFGRLRRKGDVKELLAGIGILVAVAGIIAVLTYTAYLTDLQVKELQSRAVRIEAIQVVPSWETKEARQ